MKTDTDTPLSRLRAELNRRGLDGFAVPRADEYLGEYVPASAERLAWLTGFTGSAGLAVALRERAAVFVDGRYTLQVRDEVDGAAFDYGKLVADPPDGWPPGDWLAEQLSEGQVLGYDSRLHTRAGAANLKAACQKAGAELRAVDDNPVDAAWADRPAPPKAPTVPHALAFAGRSAAEKRALVADDLKKEGHDAAVLTQPDSIAWLLNIRGGDVPFTPLALCFAIVHANADVDLFIDARKLSGETRAHLGDPVTVHAPERLGDVLDVLIHAGKAIRLDPEVTPVWFFERIKAAGGEARRGDDPCRLPKACKNEVELAGMRAAHVRDGAALTRFLAWLDATAPTGTVTEISAADRLEAFRREGEHFQGLSFPTISGAGPNGAIVHYRVDEATNRPLEAGTLYLVDSGAQYLDGTTDVTRTVAVGAPSDAMRDAFTRVLKGHIALARARFPVGTTGSQLDVLARAPLWAAGLDYDHGTGHGVGHYLSVHEGPQRISKASNRVALKPGMVVSNEPGYYKDGQFGIRIENLVAVGLAPRPSGGERDLLEFETLTLAPIDLRLIEPALLDDGEAAWLNAYHARVREALSGRVDDETARWLAAATVEIHGGQ
jgi:Xaa-Pro aminopeptidase